MLSIKYITVEKQFLSSRRWGKIFFLSIIDIDDAFRLMPRFCFLVKLDRHFVGKKVYMDTGLLIGGRSSPSIFNYLPNAVKCII